VSESQTYVFSSLTSTSAMPKIATSSKRKQQFAKELEYVEKTSRKGQKLYTSRLVMQDSHIYQSTPVLQPSSLLSRQNYTTIPSHCDNNSHEPDPINPTLRRNPRITKVRYSHLIAKFSTYNLI
jgi:hypothetical protein